MPSTYTKLYAHLVFATKNRRQQIQLDWAPDLHAYLGGCLKRANAIPIEIGGYKEHVHILTQFKATHCMSALLCDIKSASSHWVHQHISLKAFEWQEGYGAFSCSCEDIEDLRRYIQNQVDHHREWTFLEEYEELLREAGMELDSRFLP